MSATLTVLLKHHRDLERAAGHLGAVTRSEGARPGTDGA